MSLLKCNLLDLFINRKGYTDSFRKNSYFNDKSCCFILLCLSLHFLKSRLEKLKSHKYQRHYPAHTSAHVMSDREKNACLMILYILCWSYKGS